MPEVACPLCSTLFAASSLDSHLRSELRYSAWRCGYCAVHFLSLPEARLHFHPRITRHRGREENIVERADLRLEIRIADLLERAGAAEADCAAAEETSAAAEPVADMDAVKSMHDERTEKRSREPSEASSSPIKTKLQRKSQQSNMTANASEELESWQRTESSPKASDSVSNNELTNLASLESFPKPSEQAELGLSLLCAEDESEEAFGDETHDEAFQSLETSRPGALDDCEAPSESRHQPKQESQEDDTSSQTGGHDFHSDGQWFSQLMEHLNHASTKRSDGRGSSTMHRGAESSLEGSPIPALLFPAPSSSRPSEQSLLASPDTLPQPNVKAKDPKPQHKNERRLTDKDKAVLNSIGRSKALEDERNSEAELAVMAQFDGRPHRFPDWMTQTLLGAFLRGSRKFAMQSEEGDFERLWPVFGFFVQRREDADVKSKAKDLIRRLGFSLPQLWTAFRWGLRRRLGSFLLTCFRLTAFVNRRLPSDFFEIFQCKDPSLEGDWEWTMEKVYQHCAYTSPGGKTSTPLRDWADAYAFFCSGAPGAVNVDVELLLGACRHLRDTVKRTRQNAYRERHREGSR